MKQFIKFTVITFVLTIFFATTKAQTMNTGSNEYKVVFQLSDNDTLVHKTLIRQLNNLQKAMNHVKIEVITHGPGIEFLMNTTSLAGNIQELHKKGVVFLVCNNTLLEKKMAAAAILPVANIISAGIAHIIRRQAEGWSYIKAGF